jgi:hypothetical protein
MKMLSDYDYEGLAAVDDRSYQSGTSEIKLYVSVMMAMQDTGAEMTLVDYVPCYRTAAGTGEGMGFMYWDSKNKPFNPPNTKQEDNHEQQPPERHHPRLGTRQASLHRLLQDRQAVAIDMSDAPYDGIVYEMEHNPYDVSALGDSLQYLLNRKQIAESGSLAPASRRWRASRPTASR